MVTNAVVPFRPREELDLQRIGGIAAMTGIYIVKGRVTLSAHLMASLIKRSGRYDYRIKQLDSEACILTFLDRGKPIGESAFTRKDAESAGLWGKTEPWRQFPRNMLFARAMSNGARWHCADIFAGPLYTPEELGAALDGESGQPLVDLRTGEVVALKGGHTEPAPERPPAVVKVLAFWHAECEHARADGIEPDGRDFDRATEDELRESAIRLTRLRAAAERAGWPDIVHEAYELGLHPPMLSETTGRKTLAATVAAWSAAVSARREERAEAGEEGPAPEALKPAPASPSLKGEHVGEASLKGGHARDDEGEEGEIEVPF
jgi:hypothetical protein